jgi:hypothetical protein
MSGSGVQRVQRGPAQLGQRCPKAGSTGVRTGCMIGHLAGIRAAIDAHLLQLGPEKCNATRVTAPFSLRGAICRPCDQWYVLIDAGDLEAGTPNLRTRLEFGHACIASLSASMTLSTHLTGSSLSCTLHP